MRGRLLAAAVSLLAAGALAPAASAAVVLSDGHVDYAVRMVGGELQSRVKDGTEEGPPVWREPSEVVFGLGPAARTTVPAGYGFLGAPGSEVWMIPQVQRTGVLWAGWNTEEVAPGQVSGEVAWRLDAVEGPGRVAVFQTGSFGEREVIFNSGDGLPDTREIPLGTHAHGNWAFTAPGEYGLTFTMSAERAGGGTTSDTETLAVRVEGESGEPGPDPDPGPNPGGGGGPGDGDRGDPSPEGVVPRPTLRLAVPRLRGRLLAISARLSGPGLVAVAVHRRVPARAPGRRARRVWRAVARTPARRVGRHPRRLRFRLARRLGPGRYRLVVRARVGEARLRGAIALRAGGRR